MLLSILIPTYNRAPFLLENLRLLSSFIGISGRTREIEIVVANNHSSDNTITLVKDFKNNNEHVTLRFFSHSENIGLEKNALFTLKEAKGEYIMYLGDDDYLDPAYFSSVLKRIDERKIYVIIPNNYAINVDGERISKGRDDGLETTFHQGGFKNCLENSWRGHQLSGLTLKRQGIFDAYMLNRVSNIYPFIYFVAYQSLVGPTLHMTDYPVKVTMPGQQNKDWNYGSDGLLNEIFDNYKKLPLNHFEKSLLQIKIILVQPFRLWKYRKIGNGFWRAIVKVWFSKNGVFFFRILFPLLVAYMICRFEVWSKVRGYLRLSVIL